MHVLALGFELDHRDLLPYNRGDAVVGEALRAESVVRAIHAAGLARLAASGALPARPWFAHRGSSPTPGFDGGEAWYDYKMQPHWRPSPLICEAIDRQLANLGLLRTCGTDSHGIDLCGR